MEEDKSKYDYLLKLQELRHKVAHTGYRPTVEEARDAQRICSEAVQWFAGVAGLPVKRDTRRKGRERAAKSERASRMHSRPESNRAGLYPATLGKSWSYKACSFASISTTLC